VLTIPCSVSSVERSFSALKRLKTYLHSTQTQEEIYELGVLLIKKELLQKIKSSRHFMTMLLKNWLHKGED
jgi:hAT family dimerisation domain.